MKTKPRKLTEQDFYFCMKLLSDGVRRSFIARHVYGIETSALKDRLMILAKNKEKSERVFFESLIILKSREKHIFSVEEKKKSITNSWEYEPGEFLIKGDL